jgi:hypothetical protein
MDQPPITINLTGSADIERLGDGFAVSTPLVRVTLTDLLIERIAANADAYTTRASA